MTVYRNAQGFSLGVASANVAAGGPITTFTGTTQVPVLLEDLIISSGLATGGLVTSLRVAGQEIFASNLPCPVAAFNAASQVEQYRSVSLTLDQQQTFAMDINNTSGLAGTFQFSVATTPITQREVVPTSQSGDALNYCFGFGESLAIPAAPAVGSTVTLTATALRPCILGRLVITQDGAVGAGGNLAGVEVTSILVNNIELLSGAAGPGGNVPAEAFGVLSTDTNGAQLAYPVELNSNVSITIVNNSAVAVGVGAMCFCLPAV